MDNQLIIIRGLPGSGKSTYAKANFKGAFHIENDMFHIKNGKYCFKRENQKDAVKWCLDTATFALENGMDVVVSNTFTQKRFIDSYKAVADRLGCGFKVYRMAGNYGTVHDVPAEVLESMKNFFEDYEGETMVVPHPL